ncbi:MAG: excinuclease ABC subunit UvrA [Parcubacteria group bacterium]
MENKITIKNAHEHNLKNINLEIPRNKMVVFTGVSGSGKSSLAFDTIFAEGQRRYIESLSAYARQFLGGMQKPNVDDITGLSPAISIDQKAHSSNPRSTVATITEIYDYMRVLFAKIGKPHCPVCDELLEKTTIDEMVERVMENILTQKNQPSQTLLPSLKLRQTSRPARDAAELIVLSPIVRGRKGEYYQMLYDTYNSGYLEARIDGKMHSLKNRVVIDKNKKHTIEIVIDKIQLLHPMNLNDNKGFRQRLTEALENSIELANGLATVVYPDKKEKIFSTEYSCPNDGYSFPEIEPRLFSFNSPYGYCDYCFGLGTKELFSDEVCPKCHGKRLNNDVLSVKVNDKNIWQITELPVSKAIDFFNDFLAKITPKELEITEVILGEIQNRLLFMLNVGLHYLNLNRRAGTMSNGEAQRIRLASQVGTRLVGALYVLDEPTIGLHQKDNEQLIKTLRNLCDIGNTIIVVEHDENTILASDWLVDIGPAAGIHGGKIIFSGPVANILNTKVVQAKAMDCEIAGDPKTSLTGQYLRHEVNIELPKTRRKVDKNTLKIEIKGAKENNLKNISVEIPTRRLVCLTGVSGSGKSTLMHDVLYKAIIDKKDRRNLADKNYDSIKGAELIDKIIKIDQSPIGRSPRSNPATYTKAFDYIREIFASTEEARIRGYKASRFSFNRPGLPGRQAGGRCENCEGRGTLEIEMHFMPSVEIKCDVCKGKRYNKETLQVHYKHKNISDILEMTIEDAEKFFKDIPFIHDKLKVLNEVGMEYLTLGQSSKTLSGGESQRLKLSRELAKRGTTKTLYMLDEPSTGLHYDDIKKLMAVIQRLVSQGNTVMVIEHNLDIIKCSDWIIDLGPEGGENGGQIIAYGTPEDVSRVKASWTGRYLKKALHETHE